MAKTNPFAGAEMLSDFYRNKFSALLIRSVYIIWPWNYAIEHITIAATDIQADV